MSCLHPTRRSLFALAATAAAALAAPPAFAQGSLLDRGRDLLDRGMGGNGGGSGGNAAGLSSQQADSGLREALRVASQRTVSRLGRPGGFLDDPAVKIPLPGYLESARKLLASAGMSGMLDDLEVRMNRAAEQATPKAVDIFGKAISDMTISDARGIVAGPNDAATQYFKRTTTQPLTREFRPIIDQNLSQAGATQAFQKVQSNLPSSSVGTGGLGQIAGMGGLGGGRSFSLTDYAVEKALSGLFHYIGQEEAAIRTNPAARSTELLKQVFGR